MRAHGLLVFLYQDKYYIIYNHLDSGPDGLGSSILTQLYDLVHQFHGDVKSACNYWGELLVKLSFVVDSDNNPKLSHPFNTRQGYKTIKENLKENSSPVVVLHEVLSKFHVYEYFEDYSWEIDLDRGLFKSYKENILEKAEPMFDASYSMKFIYLLLLSQTRSEFYQNLWLWEFYKSDDEEGNEDVPLEFLPWFTEQAMAVLIQRNWRRYATWKTTLRPGGLNYFHAKKRFKSAVDGV